MGSHGEPAKLLLPYLQRADELQKHEPLVAYYCRLYAMEKGLRIPQKERTKTTNALLVSLMNQLEKDKKSIKLGPEDNLYIEGFASNVFAKADKQDRGGRADLNTAKTFYAASIFFEILNQFGELLPDIEEKRKYAVWKAADIRKALKEGRTPEPGPPGGDKDSSFDDLGGDESFPSNNYQKDFSSPSSHARKDMGQIEGYNPRYPDTDVSAQKPDSSNPHLAPPPTYGQGYGNDYGQFPPPGYHDPYHDQPYLTDQHYAPPNYPSDEGPNPPNSYPNFQSFPSVPTHLPYQPPGPPPFSHEPNLPSAPGYLSAPRHDLQSPSDAGQAVHSPPSSSYVYDSNYQPPVEKISEAHKAARFAVGALAFDDVATAVEHLRRSLELLTNPSAEIH